MSATARAAILIAILTVGAKAVGIFRDAILAHSFGAGAAVDIYFASFRIPDLVFNLLVAGTLSVSFIPVFVQYLHRDREAAFEIASTIFNFVLLAVGVVSILGYIFAPVFMPHIVPGFTAAAQKDTVTLTRILMLSPLLFALSSVLTSVLQSHKRFVISAVAPIFYNLGIIAGAVLFYKNLGLAALAWGAVAGAAMHMIVQIPLAVSLGLKPFSAFKLGHPGVKKIARLFLPRVFGLDLGQISMLVSTVVGSSLAAGSLAVIYFGYNLEAAPIGVFAVAFSVAAFPTLSEFAAKGDIAAFRDFFSRTAAQILFLLVPISVLMLVLRAQIVRLFLGAGQGTHFSFSDTKLTATTLGFFVLSLFAQGLIPLLSRAFYALQNTIVPVIAGLIGAAVNIALAVTFTKTAGAETLALAFSIAVVVNMSILFVILRAKLGGLGDELLILRTTKIIIASVVMGIAAYLTLYAAAPFLDMQTYVGILIQASLAGIIGLCTYLGIGYLIDLPESRTIFKIFSKKFFYRN